MSTPQTLEIWLRGPIPEVPPLLQPVAHALLQATLVDFYDQVADGRLTLLPTDLRAHIYGMARLRLEAQTSLAPKPCPPPPSAASACWATSSSSAPTASGCWATFTSATRT